jgi:hypothetical protein
MTTTNRRPTSPTPADPLEVRLARRSGTPRSTQQLLASAYAQRLSLLRCDADDDELTKSSRLIARLEARYRRERSTETAPKDVRALLEGPDHTALWVDPTLFLG